MRGPAQSDRLLGGGDPVATKLGELEVWFVTGSQHLYGDEAIQHVDEHARHIAAALDQ